MTRTPYLVITSDGQRLWCPSIEVAQGCALARKQVLHRVPGEPGVETYKLEDN